jgi:hypothetical protein
MTSPWNGRNTTIRNSTAMCKLGWGGHCNERSRDGVLTIHVGIAISLADETLRGPENVPEADKETNLLDDLSASLARVRGLAAVGGVR